MKNFVYRFRAFRRRNQQPLLCMPAGIAAHNRDGGACDHGATRILPPGAGALLKGMDAEGPDAVICLGLAANRKKISPGEGGTHYAYARIPDNDGMQPRDIPLDPSGPAACFSTLPVWDLAAELNQAEIPAEVSLSAGSYVCNCLLYHLLRAAGRMPAGFIHVPPTEAMPLEMVTRAMKLIATRLGG